MAIERTLVQIRERPLLDLLDLSLVVVRNRPFTLGLTAFLGIAPFYALNLWLFHLDGEMAPYFAWTIWMIEAPFATAPLTLVLGGLMFGQKPTFLKTLGSLLRGSFPLLMISMFVRFVLFFLIPTRLAFANEILFLERGKWWKILGRGHDLATGRAGELILLGILQMFLTWGFAYLFYTGITRIQEALLVETLTLKVASFSTFTTWRFQIPIWIVVAFFAIVRFLTYIDQRIRLEGWEVELRLREVGEALEEARRW